MLPESHPDAWDVSRAWRHMSPQTRRHLLPAHGNLVVTREMRTAANAVPLALRRGASVLVSGEPGAGKSVLLAALTAVSTVPVAAVELSPSQNGGVDQWQKIAQAVTGETVTGKRAYLQDVTRDHMTANPTLMIVDEAQNIGVTALMQLRWLWGMNFPGCAVILAGAGLNEHVAKNPQLSGRVDMRILLNPLGRQETIQRVQASHPLAAQMPVGLLKQIDDVYAQGSWRLWSKFLLVLDNDLGHTGPVDRNLASMAIQLISGHPLPAAPYIGGPR